MTVEAFWTWLFAEEYAEPTAGDIFFWWEMRRLPYNLFVGGVGLVSFAVFFLSIVSANVLKPGEDAAEPMGLLVAPFMVNMCYTAGWVVEIGLRRFRPKPAKRIGPLLFKLGVAFSLFVITLPAILWGGIRLLQLLGIKG